MIFDRNRVAGQVQGIFNGQFRDPYLASLVAGDDGIANTRFPVGCVVYI